MKTYNVTIKGIQKHISGDKWENVTANQVESILLEYWDEEYPKPQFDGEFWELNVSQNICIEEVK